MKKRINLLNALTLAAVVFLGACESKKNNPAPSINGNWVITAQNQNPVITSGPVDFTALLQPAQQTQLTALGFNFRAVTDLRTFISLASSFTLDNVISFANGVVTEGAGADGQFGGVPGAPLPQGQAVSFILTGSGSSFELSSDAKTITFRPASGAPTGTPASVVWNVESLTANSLSINTQYALPGVTPFVIRVTFTKQ